MPKDELNNFVNGRETDFAHDRRMDLINPSTGEVLRDGEEGELVFTTLTKEALPMIRYRTRDLTRLLPPTARAMRRFDKITGRSDDMLIIGGVNVFPTQVEEVILKVRGLAPWFQLFVSRDGPMDKMDVHVEMRPEIAADDPAVLVAAARELQHYVKSYIGISTRVKVLQPNSIERLAGKARRVVDQRPKG